MKSIALLVCDTPIPSVKQAHGTYHEFFTSLLQQSAKALGISDDACFTLDAYDVVNDMAYPPEDKAYDGILITGSKASAYAAEVEWINKLVDYVAHVARDKPQVKIVGICFGHQIVARALGGVCIKNPLGWEVGPTDVPLTTLGKQIFGGADSLYVEQMHQDHVCGVPPGFRLLGSTDISENQGMVRFASTTTALSDVHIFTVQGHPEFTDPIVLKIIAARKDAGIIPTEIALAAENAANRTNGKELSNVVIGKAILRVYGIKGE
ncbi:class I glutamine amidotransferase-like protein [Roridomyces roridus]|uniref:Class I glutamine amidotransferase-like protein n=1 Tax=Roridomyces roridus TaxID=1738132 RepID=A0AAD7BHT3_9AGAR|nr:class I glutamine amidotransferase-like protein [Roridomyces roridus]